MSAVPPGAAASPLFLREAEVRRGIELLYFGGSALVEAADAVLAEAGLGRAHHRALYLIGRTPGLTVGTLIRQLGITKQSLGRVMSELTARGLVVSEGHEDDGRKRLLQLSEDGLALEAKLFEPLRATLAKGYERAGQDAVTGMWRVLEGLAAR
ncbi:HTH marR-type domain-containing protein [Sphingomonas antarctica]|uniref:MarR family winged helix-turn-helix transcriptional regulator n=1 Tax=Sphingomonas antarctica TaxID=2040274 RepID=UPI0039E83AD1